MKNGISIFAFIILGLFLMSVFLPSTVWAQNSSSNEYGEIKTDQETYFLERGTPTPVTISGVGYQPANNNIKEKVFLTYKFPDLTEEGEQIFSTTKGKFFTVFHLEPDFPVGQYEISTDFKKKSLDKIYFYVEKASSGSAHEKNMQQQVSGSTTATITLCETDIPHDRYEKGDSVCISGHTEDIIDVVTLQILDPKDTRIHIDQTKPGLDGAYSFILKTSVEQLKHEGKYTARVTSATGEQIEEFFHISNPVRDNPITLSTTTLTDLTLERGDFIGSGLEVNIPVSGYLTKWDGIYYEPLNRQYIDIVDLNTNERITTTQTDGDGYFTTVLKGVAGKTYQIQAVYNGSPEYEVSSSGKHRITIPSIAPFMTSPPTTSAPTTSAPTTSAPSPQPAATPAFDPNGIVAGLVAVIIIIGIIVAIAKRRKKTAISRASYKPKRQPPKPQPPKPQPLKPTIQPPPQTVIFVEGPKKTHRFACPDCYHVLKRDFVKQTCAQSQCGYDSDDPY